jgi:phenylglyoxylate dehydrogenase epsilon subunit
MEKYVILGASTAGISAVEAIRKADHAGGITLISKERHMPYTPMILPYIISGIIKDEGLALRDDGFFEQKRVKLIRGKKVVGIEPAKKMLNFEGGETARFEKLLIATGARPLIPDMLGTKLQEVCSLRTLEDAVKVRKLSDEKKSVAVIGAGLVAMHLAEVLSKKGLQVKVVEMLPQILGQNFDAFSASMIQKVFEARGVEFYLGTPASGIRKKGAQLSVGMKDGREIDAEFAVLATGVRPRIELLEGTGIKCRKGVLVDERMCTNIQDIYAAGDVAEAKDFFSGENMLSPIQPSAEEQGLVAGLNMAGKAATYPGGISMNAFKFFENGAFTVGTLEGRETAVYSDVKKNRYRKLVLEGDRIIGGIFVNDEVEPGIVLNMIKRKEGIGDLKDEIVSAGATSESWYKCLIQRSVS